MVKRYGAPVAEIIDFDSDVVLASISEHLQEDSTNGTNGGGFSLYSQGGHSGGGGSSN